MNSVGKVRGRVWSYRRWWAGAAMAATLVASPAAPAQAISGGTDADITQYPYTVSVQAPVIMCAGALVDLKHVVTTATCVNFLTPEDVSVHAGSSKYYEGGVEKSVTAIDIAPNYNKTNNYDSNIAVLTLSSALPRSKRASYVGSFL